MHFSHCVVDRLLQFALLSLLLLCSFCCCTFFDLFIEFCWWNASLSRCLSYPIGINWINLRNLTAYEVKSFNVSLSHVRCSKQQCHVHIQFYTSLWAFWCRKKWHIWVDFQHSISFSCHFGASTKLCEKEMKWCRTQGATLFLLDSYSAFSFFVWSVCFAQCKKNEREKVRISQNDNKMYAQTYLLLCIKWSNAFE